MLNLSILASLFLTSFAAATIIPAQSEILLSSLILKTDLSLWLLLTVASIGNIMGSCVNWLLGRYLERFKNRKWFPVNQQSLEKAQDRYMKYGRWSLLLCWMPIIGDPITVIAGTMREKFLPFLCLVSIAKISRYAVIAFPIQFSN